MKLLVSDLPDGLSSQATHWLYNGMDAAVTHEIAGNLYPTVNRGPYDLSMKMNGPALAMMRRGLLVDLEARDRIYSAYQNELNMLADRWNQLCLGIFDRTFNYNSPTAIGELFHQYMNIPKHYTYDKATAARRPTVNEEALEKFKTYYWAEIFSRYILALREKSKFLSTILMPLSPERKAFFSFNTVGTNSGRWSSSRSVAGFGTNFQNITEELREIFVAEHGHIFGNYDLEQAESRCVAYLSGDEAYIAACESGDLHTTCCRWIWPDLPWTGDLEHDKRIANETKFFRHFSYRDISKRAGHASNYYAKDHTLAERVRIPLNLARTFQEIYFDKFPGIKRWQNETIRQVQETGTLVTPLGRVAHFFDRLDDPATHRKAIAWVPQSLTGDTLNHILFNVWKALDPHIIKVRLQIHDAFLFSTHLSATEAHRTIAPYLHFATHINGRSMVIPVDCKYGYNWGKRVVKKDGTVVNPRGLGSCKVEIG